MFNIQGVLQDVQNLLNGLQHQHPGIQINFNGNMFQPQQHRHGHGHQQQQWFANGQHDEYGEEYDNEEPLDEDGVPLPSPEEIKNVINAIPSFKYEEKKKNSDNKNDETTNKDSCAICLDDLQTGQQVKALQCTHKFHS